MLPCLVYTFVVAGDGTARTPFQHLGPVEFWLAMHTQLRKALCH